MQTNNNWIPASVFPKENKKVILRLNTGDTIKGYFSNHNGPSYFESGIGFGTKIVDWFANGSWVVEWKEITA
jgi:hypothetical protein